MKKLSFLLILLGFIIAATGCSEKKQSRYSVEFLELFNTASQVIGYADTKEEFVEYSNSIYDMLKEYHQLYDIYNEYEGMNNIKTINDFAGIEPVKVDKRIIDLLLYSKQAYYLTDGKINIAMGSVLSIWHNYRTEGIDDPINSKLPPMDILKEASNYTSIEDVIINIEESTVYLKEKEMSLDVGGIAKGYATEQVSIKMLEQGLENALYNIGGNVRAVGYRMEDNSLWNVGVQNPELQSEEYLNILSVTELSLVTSGVYQRYYTVGGEEYHHIIDPSTLMPSDYFTAVSILCKDSGMADVLSTALFNMTYEEGLTFIESLEGVSAMWVQKDGSIIYSKGFEGYIMK